MTTPDQSLPIVDVDQAFPVLTSGGARRPAGPGGGEGGVTSAVETALRDVLGWRPRAQDTAAFTAALTPSFLLAVVEDHVVTTYSPRGAAMQADLGSVSGGQASLYSRAVSARTQIIMLLDGLAPLRPDADAENCEAYRSLVRDAVTAMISELGTPGGPRVAVVNAYLRQLLGQGPRPASGANLTGDSVAGQLGQLRVQFGLTDVFVNNVDQESMRTAFWTLVDLVLDITRAWVTLRAQFTGQTQQGFMGTQLVLISQLLSAVAEQLDDVESALDSVYVSAAERQTITLPGAQGLTLDGLLSWTRTFVTQEAPRIARDSGRDGIRTSFMPTVLDLTAQVAGLMTATGRPAITVRLPAPGPGAPGLTTGGAAVPPFDVQVPLLTIGPRTRMPPGLQSSRVMIAVSGLDSLLWQLARLATRIARSMDAVLFDAIAVPSHARDELLIAVRGLGIQPTFVPVFRSAAVGRGLSGEPAEFRPLAGRTSYDDDTVSAVFQLSGLEPWLNAYDALPAPDTPAVTLERFLTGATAGSRFLRATDLPMTMRDSLTGRRVRNLQTRP